RDAPSRINGVEVSLLQKPESHRRNAAIERDTNAAQARLRYRGHAGCHQTKGHGGPDGRLSMRAVHPVFHPGRLRSPGQALSWLHELVRVPSDHASARRKTPEDVFL